MQKVFARVTWTVLLIAGCGGVTNEIDQPQEVVRQELCGYDVPASITQQLVAARNATIQYRDFDNAVAAGYVDTGLPCIDGQGYHWIRPDLLNTYDITQPTALLYDTDFELVALEWVTPVDSVGGVRPVLFGETYHGPVLDPPLFVLHVWTESCNEAGVFADANPDESCTEDD